MSLYDKSSLIQVPSLYKDGTLVSTIPEDRSGDFTVVRGSNLSATRVGEDGYIKKGYENLLYPSNDLASLSNNTFSGVNVDSNQIANPIDGAVTADKIYTTVSGTSESRARISGYIQSGIQTVSLYAKYIDYKYLYIRELANSQYSTFDIELGSVTYSSPYFIETKIEPVVNDWYRCSITFNASTINNNLIDIGFSASSTSPFGNVQDGVEMYLFGYMLNQGLVAYPYLETTTAPVQGGLLENTPRLDWSNGVPAVLVEEGSTNDIDVSEGILSGFNNSTPSYNEIVSPEGVKNAVKVTITGASQAGVTTSNAYVSLSTTYTQSCYVKKDIGDYFGFGLFQVGMPINNNNYIRWDLSNITLEPDVQGSYVNGKAEDVGNGWVRLSATITTIDSGSRSGWKFLNMTVSLFQVSEVGNSFFIYGLQAEPNKTSVSSYIPTYGTTQTRSSETISDNFNIPTTATIYNSFYSDVAETVFVLDQVFNVVVGLNKVAIAFSPTAVKISVGGSIVANATGTYDTSSLTNIQLGSDNGSDYSNAPISGFYVFPEFLTDEELNSLTD